MLCGGDQRLSGGPAETCGARAEMMPQAAALSCWEKSS